jgi:segregation and condensation protein B
MDPILLKRIIEATLLAAAQPLTVQQLLALLGEDTPVSHEDVARALAELADDCAQRGVELKEVASGFRYQVREDVHAWVARLWTERQTKYSRALLETLALIAYRQPITRAEIEQIRGVAVSTSIVKTLEEREWVRVVGHRDVPGRPALFGTTRHFLDYFNLKSLDELPPLAAIRDMDEFDPQLTLAPIGMDAVVTTIQAEAALAVDADDNAGADADADEAPADADGESAALPTAILDSAVEVVPASGSADPLPLHDALPGEDDDAAKGPLEQEAGNPHTPDSHPDATEPVTAAPAPSEDTTASHDDAPEHTA